jgi:hypothetical protein
VSVADVLQNIIFALAVAATAIAWGVVIAMARGRSRSPCTIPILIQPAC